MWRRLGVPDFRPFIVIFPLYFAVILDICTLLDNVGGVGSELGSQTQLSW